MLHMGYDLTHDYHKYQLEVAKAVFCGGRTPVGECKLQSVKKQHCDKTVFTGVWSACLLTRNWWFQLKSQGRSAEGHKFLPGVRAVEIKRVDSERMHSMEQQPQVTRMAKHTPIETIKAIMIPFHLPNILLNQTEIGLSMPEAFCISLDRSLRPFRA